MARRRKVVVFLPRVLGLTPYPCEAMVTGDPDRCLTRVWSCPGYHVCLSVTCKTNWRSFTCRACPVFQRYWAAGSSIVQKVAR